MKDMVKKGLVYWAAAAAALLSLAWAPAARAHDDGDDRALRAAIEHAERGAAPGKRPIVETHIHFWQVTRPGGVPWPTPAEGPIFRDVLPPEYTPHRPRQRRRHGRDRGSERHRRRQPVDPRSGEARQVLLVLRRQPRDRRADLRPRPGAFRARPALRGNPRLSHRPGRRHHAQPGTARQPARPGPARHDARHHQPRARRTPRIRCRRCAPRYPICASSSTTWVAPRDRRRWTPRGSSRFAASPTSARTCT